MIIKKIPMLTHQVIHYTKQGVFWLAYIALMGFFTRILIYLLPAFYYIITDYSYWRINFTPFHPDLSPEPPTVGEYIDLCFLLFLCAAPWGYNIWLIFKKKSKKHGLILLLSVAVFLYFYGILKCKYWAFCG